MKCFHSILIGFVIVACFFLSGFKKHIHNHEASAKTQHSSVGVKKQTMPLDLTLSFKDSSFKEVSGSLVVVQDASLGVLATQDKAKARVIELQGNVIMSQEPEAGKSKTADGAGIMINLHH
jgi:hypothetical protein